MNIDEIKIGKTYALNGACARRIVGINCWPAGRKYINEYREAIVDIIQKDGRPRRCSESLGWIADRALKEIT